MFYRVTLNLASKNEGIITGLAHHALALLDQTETINPGQENEELGYIQLEHCYHDEQPLKPCRILDTWQTPSGQPSPETPE